MEWRHTRGPRGVLVMVFALAACAPRDAAAQLGALVSPGRLSRPHAALEGITNCLQCHTVGRGVAADKCLGCHAPVAQRIAQKRGIHRAVTTDCVACHVEHAGIDGELRPFDLARFNHRTDTAFQLDGLHAPLTKTCAACHATRSFLAAPSACASCHADVHKGSLGSACETCHTASVPFADVRTTFDHSRTAFPLTGAHGAAGCATCHTNGTYTGVAFASCTSCHTDPHQTRFGASCASCHTTETWRTTTVDHARTTFPLLGLHGTVRCVACHTKPALQVETRAETCATCHADPHGGVFKQDCGSCHSESGFARAEKSGFDHSSTRFPLVDAHADLTCATCHTPGPGATTVPAAAVRRPASARTPGAAVADFRGLQTACASCHTDVHRGELGTTCETCHTAHTFTVTAFSHTRPRPFFDGEHLTLTCAECHTSTYETEPVSAPQPDRLVVTAGAPESARTPRALRVGFNRTSDTCASCHTDPHLGQVGGRCETCHTVDTPKFAVTTFAHDTTSFPLTGRHAPLSCEACHTEATRDFPTGHGTARQLTGVGTACATCHQDPHGTELGGECQTCHTTETFSIRQYTHINTRSLRTFFTGRHVTSCAACHQPSGTGAAEALAVSYRVSTTCTSCHSDEHRGALGPRCESCHKP